MFTGINNWRMKIPQCRWESVLPCQHTLVSVLLYQRRLSDVLGIYSHRGHSPEVVMNYWTETEKDSAHLGLFNWGDLQGWRAHIAQHDTDNFHSQHCLFDLFHLDHIYWALLCSSWRNRGHCEALGSHISLNRRIGKPFFYMIPWVCKCAYF